MELTKIEDILARINSLVDGWKSMDAVPAIERDVVLASLRDLYSQLLDMRGDESLAASVAETIAATPSVEHKPEAVESPAQAAPEEVATETTPAEEAVESAEEPIKSVAEEDPFADIFDIEALLGLSDEERSTPESEAPAIEVPEAVVSAPAEVAPAPAPIPAPAEVAPAPAPIPAPAEVAPAPAPIPAPAEVAPAPAPIPAPAEVAPAPAPMNMGGGLFDIEDIPVRKKTNRKIISLYNTAPASAPVAEQTPEAKPVEQPRVEPKSEPKPAPSPAPSPAPAPRPTPRPMSQPTVTEAPKRLGDILGGGVTTLADKLVDDSQPTPAMSRITDLRKAIGINDKFLMVRDLFDGDVARYEDTIDTLNEFDDLDDCMIYIIENFAWNPDLEGAKLLVSLIERKLA